MDPLLSRLLAKTSELKDSRHSSTQLASSILSLAFSRPETASRPSDTSLALLVFEPGNMPRNTFIVEYLQSIVNGKLFLPFVAFDTTDSPF
jgi:hypothetical protein